MVAMNPEKAPDSYPAEVPAMNDWQGSPRTEESLIVLTRDGVLVETLQAVATERALSIIEFESDLPAHLVGGHAGVAILDTSAVTTPITKLTDRLRAQFPDLVLIVAGDAMDQAAVSAQVQRGTIYRFLHKPVSAQRVKAFVDAAWRRHESERSSKASTATQERTALSSTSPKQTRLTPAMLYGGGGALAALSVLVMWLILRPGDMTVESESPTENRATTDSAPKDTVVRQFLAQADAALARGDLTTPAGQSAVDLYQRALERDSSNLRAREGITKVLDTVLTNAEQALLDNRISEAAQLVDSARRVQADNPRVAFLTAQIAKERERALLRRAREQAERGDIGRALQTLEGGAPGAQRSTIVAETRQELREQQQIEARVVDFLQRAEERARVGALIEPERDNARFLIESAAAIDPNNENVIRARRDLARRLLVQARNTLAGDRPEDAERWFSAALEAGASMEEVQTLRREAQNVRMVARAESMARLSQLFNQRLVQGALLKPESDSALYYLRELERADSDHPSTQIARQALGTRLLDEARASITRTDLTAAEELVAEARRLGANSADAAEIEREIVAARNAVANRSDFVLESTLQRVRDVEPEYPPAARAANQEGWVELEFTVRADGTVGDVVVLRSSPPEIFDRAAVNAVRKWRYRPVLRDGQPVDQRTRLRVRFAMQ